MRKLFMALLALTCTFSTVQSSTTSSMPGPSVEFKTNTIVMEDVVVMYTSSNDPTDPIVEIKAYYPFGGLAANLPVCGGFDCSTDLTSYLPVGSYDIVVKTTKGQTITGSIYRG